MKTNHPCPRDGNLLDAVADDGLHMQSCRSCGGLWVPMAQLAPRLSKGANAFLFHTSGGRETHLRCPIDGAPMRELDIGGVHIDRCESCRGLWFDAGELTTMLGITGFAPAKEIDPDKWRAATEASTNIVDGILNSGDGLTDFAGEIISSIAEFIVGGLSF